VTKIFIALSCHTMKPDVQMAKVQLDHHRLNLCTSHTLGQFNNSFRMTAGERTVREGD
jgi:hypothetical protein